MKAIAGVCAVFTLLGGIACDSLAQTPQEFQQLVQQANAAFSSGDWEKSEEL